MAGLPEYLICGDTYMFIEETKSKVGTNYHEHNP
jgi:hypothetical protein